MAEAELDIIVPEVRMNEDMQAFKRFCERKGYNSPLLLVNVATGRVLECKAFDVEHEVWIAGDKLGAFWIERY